MSLAATALRGITLLGVLAALGGWVFTRLVIPRAAGQAVESSRASLARVAESIALAGAALVALLIVPRAVVQALDVAAPGTPLGTAVLALLKSGWGIALLTQGLGAAVVFVGLRTAGASWRTADAGVVFLAVTPAFLGHAITDPDHAFASVIVDILHTAAAGGWIGGLLVLTALARALRARADAGAVIASLIIAFHPVALACAGAVFVTGLTSAWLRMGAPEGIANPTYSGLFVVKLVLVVAAGAVGAGHAKLAKKRVATVDRPSMTRSLVNESLIAALVITVTAVLVGTAPIG